MNNTSIAVELPKRDQQLSKTYREQIIRYKGNNPTKPPKIMDNKVPKQMGSKRLRKIGNRGREVKNPGLSKETKIILKNN